MAPRGITWEETVTLVTEECCNCHVLFGITDRMQRDLRQSHNSFYCPNGHGQHYSDRSDKQRLAEERQRVASLQEDLRVERLNVERAKKDAEKLRRRAAAGVCPCCHRQFQNVARHMKGQHPKYAG